MNPLAKCDTPGNPKNKIHLNALCVLCRYIDIPDEVLDIYKLWR
jgi:hypothetical protein